MFAAPSKSRSLVDSDLENAEVSFGMTAVKSNSPGPLAGYASGSALQTELDRAQSVLRYGRIDLIRPGQDAAFEVPNLAETGLLQELHGVGGTLSTAAVSHNFARAI